MTPELKFGLGITVAALAAIFCIMHVLRAIIRNNGFSSETMKMYMVFMLAAVIAMMGLGDLISGDAMTGLFGAVIGYVLGRKFTSPKQKERANRDQGQNSN